jgi:D-alanyl-D-alanine-carboxypeptidase/D-alanyl-D-alanine-endopeptidase
MSKIVPPTTKYLDGLVDPLLNQTSGIAFVIGYVGPTFQDIYFKGNLANQFGQSVPLGKDTHFELASISKTFTATVSAALGLKLGISWKNQTIENYNGTAGLQIGTQFNSIPLSTLLSYTSGLPADNVTASDDPPDFPTPYSAAGMLGYLNMTTLQPSNIATAFTYSNMAFSIIAQILPLFQTSRALLDFTALMSEVVLRPLGMDHTHFFDAISIDQFALGYSHYKSKTPYPVNPGWPYFDAWYGAGGVVSTPHDMMTWLRYNMGLIRDTKDRTLWNCLMELQSPATSVLASWGDNIGLGWFLTPEASFPPSGAVWKDGEITGTNTYIVFLPWVSSGKPSEAGVFVMTNCDSLYVNGVEAVAAIADDVLLTMLGMTPPADKSSYPRFFGR